MIIYLLFLLIQPQLAMMLIYLFDKEMRLKYGKCWTQTELDNHARAYHQHLINHAYISLLGVVAFKHSKTLGGIILAVSLLIPLIKELIVDTYFLHKPFLFSDLRQRLYGAIMPLPLLLT